MFEEFVKFVREIYNTDDFIPLHEPMFRGHEKKYLLDTIESTFVSSVGEYVNKFEFQLEKFTGVKHVIATVNGTSALHVALLLAGVEENDEVITQSLTFVATCNAISYCGAKPVFVDVDKKTMGLSATSLSEFLDQHTFQDDGVCKNKRTGKKIKACMPMHTFGHPVDIEAICEICEQYNIFVVEDAAESLGSYYKGKHTGNFGCISALSFNGNKIITTGGGGAILTNNSDLAEKAKHLTTTARISKDWHFMHDEIGFNYRMPNLNAALGCAQIEELALFLKSKRHISELYMKWCNDNNLVFVTEPDNAQSNYWLNTILFNDSNERDAFLTYTNKHNVLTRPVWTPLHTLPMYKTCQTTKLNNTEWLAQRLVNIPSSVQR